MFSKSTKSVFLQKKGENSPTSVSLNELEQFFDIIYRSELIFPSEEFRKEVAKNCPYLLRSQWVAKNVRGNYNWEKLLANEIPPMVIKWIDNTVGYGVFAGKDLDAGTLIGEYTGVVRRLYRSSKEVSGVKDYSKLTYAVGLSQSPTAQVIFEQSLSDNSYCFHYPTRFWSWKYFAIDALNQGTITRFLNHSDNPNLDPICFIDDDKILHLMFITNKPIREGTQITFNYGEDYWIHRKKVEF